MIMITAKDAIVKQVCPMCGKIHEMHLDKESAMKYFAARQLVQEAFPDLAPTEREFIISGYCVECQKALFGDAKSDKITEVA